MAEKSAVCGSTGSSTSVRRREGRGERCAGHAQDRVGVDVPDSRDTATLASDGMVMRAAKSSSEWPLVVAAIAWCWCIGRPGSCRLAVLCSASLLNVAVFPEVAEESRRHASTGLLLGTTVLPTLFVVDSETVDTLAVAFKLTWWCSIMCNAMRVWRRSDCAALADAGKSARASRIISGLAFLVMICVPAACCVDHLPGSTKVAGLDWTLLPALAVFVIFLSTVQRVMPRSFTEGEAVVAAQLYAVLFHVMLYAVVLDVTPLDVLTSKLRKIIAIGLFCACAISAINFVFRQFILAHPTFCGWRLLDHRSVCHAVLTLFLLVGTFTWMSESIGENSLQWFATYVTSHTATPLRFLVYYVVVLVPALRLAPLTGPGCMRQVVIRKYFHLVATVLCAPTILVNIRFMALVFAVVLSVMVVLEALRMSDVSFVCDAMDPFMKRYVDDRDEGAAVLTHIYLLTGCALPVFFTYFVLRGLFSASGLLIALSGVSVTGLGDAAASYCGVHFGRHRWPGSKKTLEGTLGMVFMVLVFQVLCLRYVGFHNLSSASWVRLVLADCLVSLLEARTDQIDNLFLPLYLSLIHI